MTDILRTENAVQDLEQATDKFKEIMTTEQASVDVPGVGPTPSLKARVDTALQNPEKKAVEAANNAKQSEQSAANDAQRSEDAALRAEQAISQTVVWGGDFTPTPSNEYPDTSAINKNTEFKIKLDRDQSYIFTGGQLVGIESRNLDTLIFETKTQSFLFIPSGIKDAVTNNELNNVTDSVNNLHTKREAIEWKPGLMVTDPLQLYSHDGFDYLPNPNADQFPFTTGALFKADNWVLSELITSNSKSIITVNNLPQYPHVLKYTDDNKRLRGILEGRICSLEGETYNITEQIIINGDKTIRTNYDTLIKINSKIDSPIVFNGLVQQDGNGRVTIDGKMNDKADGTCALLTMPNNMPRLKNWDLKNANGCSLLIGLSVMGGSAKGKGSGGCESVNSYGTGKGIHAYGDSTKTARFDLNSCKTDDQTGNTGNLYYLSGLDTARLVYCDMQGLSVNSSGQPTGGNINRSKNGFYVGGNFGGGRGPTFGEDLEAGSITGGGISRGCTYAGISTDLKTAGGLYPVGELTVEGWQFINCNRSMFIQGQQVNFGNLVTRNSTATDFVFRINGASPDFVTQTGALTFVGCTSGVPLIWLGNQSKVSLNKNTIFHDLPATDKLIVQADGDNVIYMGDTIIQINDDFALQNVSDFIFVTLVNSVTTLSLPKPQFNNIKNQVVRVMIVGGDSSKRLRVALTQGSGTINDGTSYIDIIPETSKEISIFFLGNGNYWVA